MNLRILALEPYFGGSHRAFLDGLTARSKHDWTILQLPPNKWKWRMRHSAVTFAEKIRSSERASETGLTAEPKSALDSDAPSPDRPFDVVFASDMLNLAEFLGLAPRWLRKLPSIAYFHENQITYPVQHEDERDYHFNFMNITTGLAADAVWFNSAYHRDVFLDAAKVWLKKMPDFVPLAAVDAIAKKSAVHSPGVTLIEGQVICEHQPATNATDGMHLVWAARWEHDKGPELFFKALQEFKKRSGAEFQLSVIGESFRESPAIFESARKIFSGEIVNWGYAESRADYESALSSADVLVSTAAHEFFGITVVEAMSAGVYPLVPWALAYPEVVGGCVGQDGEDCFHDSTVDGIVVKLMKLNERHRITGSVWVDEGGRRKTMAAVKAKYEWPVVTQAIDDALIQMVSGSN